MTVHHLCSAVKRLIPPVLFLAFVVLAFCILSKDAKHRTRKVFHRKLGAGQAKTIGMKVSPKHDSLPPAPKKTFGQGAINWLFYGQNNDRQQQNDEEPEAHGVLPTFNKEDIENRYPALQLGGDHKNDRWIVLTTIQAPTDDVKFMAGIKGWQVVVVGDTKTPGNWNWSNCHFINVDFQQKMGLRLPGMLPTKSYSRKNVGYLYAIAHGAKIIYETDDDNRPFDKLTGFQYSGNVSGLMFAGSRLFNAYQYFGQSTLWQRGYPLGKVGKDVQSEFRVSRSWQTPLIQQGVVNGDPDVDAIFRLTRKFSNYKLDVTFDPAGPPVILPPGVFSPTNTQNTLFRYQALWALFIPISLNFRTCDIWRGYVAQRLLWEIGGYQAFYPPNCIQIRNNHDLMEDMAEENQMYFTTDALLEFLYKWACPQNFSFFQCVYKLMVDLVENKDLIFDVKDIVATKVWLEDLIILGYKEPKRVEFDAVETGNYGERLENQKTAILMKGTVVRYAPAEQRKPTISWQPRMLPEPCWRFVEGVSSNCPLIKTFPKEFVLEIQNAYDMFHDVLLVIYVSPAGVNVNYRTLVDNLEFYYRPVFPNIVLCGNNAEKFQKDSEILKRGSKQTFIELSETFSADHVCLAKALQMNFRVAGYMMIRHDVIISPKSLVNLKKDEIWMATYGNALPRYRSLVLEGPNGKLSYKKAIDAFLNMNYVDTQANIRSAADFVVANSKIKPIPFAAGSIIYLPNRVRDAAEFYFSHFGAHGVASEIAIHSVLTGIEDKVRIESLSKYGVVAPNMHDDKSRLCDFISKQIIQF